MFILIGAQQHGKHHHHSEHPGLKLTEGRHTHLSLLSVYFDINLDSLLAEEHEHHHHHDEEIDANTTWTSNTTHDHHADDLLAANLTEAEKHAKFHHHHETEDISSESDQDEESESKLHEHHHHHLGEHKHKHQATTFQHRQADSKEVKCTCKKGEDKKGCAKHDAEHSLFSASVMDNILNLIKNGVKISNVNGTTNLIFAIAAHGGSVVINGQTGNISSVGDTIVKVIDLSEKKVTSLKSLITPSVSDEKLKTKQPVEAVEDTTTLAETTESAESTTIEAIAGVSVESDQSSEEKLTSTAAPVVTITTASETIATTKEVVVEKISEKVREKVSEKVIEKVLKE